MPSTVPIKSAYQVCRVVLNLFWEKSTLFDPWWRPQVERKVGQVWMYVQTCVRTQAAQNQAVINVSHSTCQAYLISYPDLHFLYSTYCDDGFPKFKRYKKIANEPLLPNSCINTHHTTQLKARYCRANLTQKVFWHFFLLLHIRLFDTY